MKKKLDGEVLFEKFYCEKFGARWQSLKAVLLAPKSHSAYSRRLLKPYFLDEASVCAASLLPVESAQKILDLCAAPGGKSLVIASRMAESARLFCNERSFERKLRLDSVLREHLSGEILARTKTFCSDGATFFKREGEFDCVLLDAPCSSERHVISSPEYLRQWSPARPKNLAFAQRALAGAAFLSLKRGGIMVYSTCSLCDEENDRQIERLLKRRADAALLPIGEGEVALPFERTKFGIMILPDFAFGAGPIFASKIKRLA